MGCDDDGCCPNSRVPVLEKAESGKGTWEDVNDRTKVYTTGDKGSKKVIVVQPDVYGGFSGRHASICDYFAEKGYYVVMADYFGPERMKGSDFVSYITKYPIEEVQKELDGVYQKYVGEDVEKGFVWESG